MSAEHWPGDSGDVIAALWPTIIDRVIADATETTLNLIGSVTGMGDLGTQHREFGDWLDTLTYPECYADPAQYTALAGSA